MEPTTYRIETVSDFLQVPADRRVKCLAEFLSFLAFAENASVLADLLGPYGAVVKPLNVFKWTDDDKNEAHVTVTLQDGEGNEQTVYQQTYKL